MKERDKKIAREINKIISASKHRRIHTTELAKQTDYEEDEIKKVLQKIAQEHPQLGTFDYSSGWLEAIESSTDRDSKRKPILVIILCILSSFLVLYLPDILTIPWLVIVMTGLGYGIGSLFSLYYFEHKEKETSRSKADLNIAKAFK